MQPPSFAHRREAECLAIAMAINPGLAANPVLLPSLAKNTEHPQSSCLLFPFLSLLLSLLSSLCILTLKIMLSVHPGYFPQVLLFSLLSIPQERCSGYTAGLGASCSCTHTSSTWSSRRGFPTAAFSSENFTPFPKAECATIPQKQLLCIQQLWPGLTQPCSLLLLHCPLPNSLWSH